MKSRLNIGWRVGPRAQGGLSSLRYCFFHRSSELAAGLDRCRPALGNRLAVVLKPGLIRTFHTFPCAVAMVFFGLQCWSICTVFLHKQLSDL